MTNKHYHDLFIDLDDTLYDTYGNSMIALRKLFDERQWQQVMPSFEAFRDAYYQTNHEVWEQYAHGEINRDTLIVERFRQPVTRMIRQCSGDTLMITPTWCVAVSDRYGDIISREPGIVEGARDLLVDLKAKGYRMHICSNGFHEVQYRKLRSSGLEPFFTTVILSEDAGANKPRKAFFDYALEQTGASRGETLMIGDHYDTDIAGALHAGIDAILFNRWQIDVNSLDPQPQYAVNHLSEIKDILL